MKSCELCGAEVPEDLTTCPRCGFEFPKEIRADVRDRAILKKHQGKSVDTVKRDLKNRQTQLQAYLDNLDAKALSKEEMVALLDEALGFLNVPLVMGVEDELRFSEHETGFINTVARNLERTDSANDGPVATVGTYIRLTNALHSLGEDERAMSMIDSALLINPRDQDALYGKAKLLFYGKKYQAARRCLEKLMAKGDNRNAAYLTELIDQLSPQ